MFNELWWIGFALINFLIILMSYRFFGKTGVFVWIGISTVIANIQVIKTVELFGFMVTLGNVMYGTAFFATDILNENYGKKEAKKAVWIGFFSLLTMTVIMQMALRFQPHEFDIAQDALDTIFSLMPRIALGSLAAYLTSQFFDVWIYHILKKVFPKEKQLWIRNNGSTMISQLLDTLIFSAIAFLGVYELSVWFEIFYTTYFMKWLVAAMDTPFLYLAKRMKQKVPAT